MEPGCERGRGRERESESERARERARERKSDRSPSSVPSRSIYRDHARLPSDLPPTHLHSGGPTPPNNNNNNNNNNNPPNPGSPAPSPGSRRELQAPSPNDYVPLPPATTFTQFCMHVINSENQKLVPLKEKTLWDQSDATGRGGMEVDTSKEFSLTVDSSNSRYYRVTGGAANSKMTCCGQRQMTFQERCLSYLGSVLSLLVFSCRFVFSTHPPPQRKRQRNRWFLWAPNLRPCLGTGALG